MKFRFAVFTATLGIAGALPALAAGEVPAPLRQAVERANSAWDTQMRRGDAAGIASAYAADGVFVALDGRCFRGPREIEGQMRRRFETSGKAVQTSLHSRRLIADGEFGFEWGDASMTFRGAGGKSAESRGGYFTVWRRDREGNWKIFRNLVLP